MIRKQKGIVNCPIPAETDDVIQRRVSPLVDRDSRRFVDRHFLASVIRNAYLQGAMDALEMAPRILGTK